MPPVAGSGTFSQTAPEIARSAQSTNVSPTTPLAVRRASSGSSTPTRAKIWALCCLSVGAAVRSQRSTWASPGSTPFGAESRGNYRKGIRENQPAPAMPWTFATCRAERLTTRPSEATGLKPPAGA